MKNFGMIILIIVLFALALYLYFGLMECKNVATGLAIDMESRLGECGASLEKCMTQLDGYEQTLADLEVMCAPYFFEEFEGFEE